MCWAATVQGALDGLRPCNAWSPATWSPPAHLVKAVSKHSQAVVSKQHHETLEQLQLLMCALANAELLNGVHRVLMGQGIPQEG